MQQQFKLVFRSILKSRLNSLVSIAGLAIAIAVILLVSALLPHEFSHKKNYTESDLIFRLGWINGGAGDQIATTPKPFSDSRIEGETADRGSPSAPVKALEINHV